MADDMMHDNDHDHADDAKRANAPGTSHQHQEETRSAIIRCLEETRSAIIRCLNGHLPQKNIVLRSSFQKLKTLDDPFSCDFLFSRPENRMTSHDVACEIAKSHAKSQNRTASHLLASSSHPPTITMAADIDSYEDTPAE